MDNTYDYIILGGGHNGLILQAYLGRAGYKTACIERSAIAGGGLSTMEDPRNPGFLHNTHSFFHRGITNMPWFQELNLEYYGADYIEPELSTAIVRRDGEVLEWWTDIERTADSFARFNKKDSRKLLTWYQDFIPIVDEILVPESQSVPVPPEEREARLSQSPEGRLLMKTSRLSPLDFVLQEFENPFVQAGLLFFNGLREVDLRCPGFGHHIPALFASKGRPQMVRGGSRSLARALERVVHANGGELHLQTTPKEILVRDNQAYGVLTENGETFYAKQGVVSSLNPQQTFVELLREQTVPGTWRSQAEAFEYNLLAPLFALNLNLEEPPEYTASKKHPELVDALMIVLGLEDVSQFYEIVKHHENGTIPPTVMWGCAPTHFDPLQAPKGYHTAFMWEKLPYRLKGDPGNWEEEKEHHGAVMLELWSEYAPNLKRSTMDWFVRTAVDTYRSLPNMREGDLLVGSFENGQTGFNRPFPGAGQYATCIDGLYLCGSSCHPGGNVTGLPAFNAAQVILNNEYKGSAER